MPPRFHNVLSYSVAAASLPIAVAAFGHLDFASYTVALWVLHFVRRAAESLWVHRYSGRPVPLGDALVEYVYYWGFGAWIGWASAGAAGSAHPWLEYLALALFFTGEFGNAWAHIKLRRLRTRSGIQARALPSGGLFDVVDCPHYLFEILSWLGFACVTNVLPSWVFVAVVTAILSWYAHTRHQRYLSEFDGRDGRPAYPAGRRALLPGLF